jgi:pyruvate carboxylase
VDFEKEFETFQKQYDNYQGFSDFLSWKFYPKVFDEYYRFRKQYGDVSSLPTVNFFYGMKPNEEILVDIGTGKTLLIRLLYVAAETDDNGNRAVFFRLNGQTRSVEVKDRKAQVKKVTNPKASGADQIGAPLQGRLSKVFVKGGEAVKKNTPLFTIEAMKMETTITAPRDLTVKQVSLSEGSMVETDDLVVSVG